jgi:putative transposase
MDHRVEFISRLNAGEKMTDLCIEYGVSRKTGHKLKNRYEELGPSGLEDRPMGPRRIPHKTTPEVIKLIVGERRRHPSWGPKKLKAVLEKRLGRELPAASTFGNILVREGLVEPTAGTDLAIVRRARRCEKPRRRMTSGASTTRANFGWETAATATR